MATADGTPEPTKFIEAAALLSHVQMLQAKMPQDRQSNFGHPQPPQLAMCRVPHPDNPRKQDLDLLAVLAYTNRCASAQVLQESVDFSAVGAPSEVILLSDDERVTCAAILPLELPDLSADDALIVPARNASFDENSQAISLMSGSIVPVATPPRVVAIFGTNHSRVLCVEFSVKAKEMQLVRRETAVGKDYSPYFQPLPLNQLTPTQQAHVKKSNKKKDDKTELKRQTTTSSVGSSNTNNRSTLVVQEFAPSGGVSRIIPHSIPMPQNIISAVKSTSVTHVWVSFGDGSAIRLHHAGFFPSVTLKQSEMMSIEGTVEQGMPSESLERTLGQSDCFVRCEARLRHPVAIVPLPKPHPSPMASIDMGPGAIQEAMVIGGDALPTLLFLTSENQWAGDNLDMPSDEKKSDEDSNVLGSVLGGAGAILGGIVGGIFRSGGREKVEPKSNEEDEPMKEETTVDPWNPAIPFPSMNLPPIQLFAAQELHDPPRLIQSCTIDPSGDLAALSDSLGRVSLIDLESKQVVRMWKGYRETTCSWIEVANVDVSKPWLKRAILYLVIHSRIRRVVEVWKMRHGGKVKSIQVGRDAQIVMARESSPVGLLSVCYIVNSNIPFSNMNQIEKITFDAGASEMDPPTLYQTPKKRSKPEPLDAAQRLQRLQQLLGNSNIKCESVDVFRALQNIKSLQDLASALDLLSVAPALEERMEIEGATFQRLAVSHCRQKLEEAIKEGGRESLSNPIVQLLAFKITYYSQIIKAYDALHRFELGSKNTTDDGGATVEDPSRWTVEALGWAACFEKIMKRSVDDGIEEIAELPVMKFFVFAQSFTVPKECQTGENYAPGKNGKYKIYLSDSSKTRRDLLVHLFRPLLADIFSFGVVNAVFDSLGIGNDVDYLLKCFGEWFVTLPIKTAAKKGMFALGSPMGRWLEELVGNELGAAGRHASDVAIKPLHDFCSGSDDLIRAFFLGAFCHDAVEKASIKKEEESYGKIESVATGESDLFLRKQIPLLLTHGPLVEPWQALLRKIRICLLVSLRLGGIQLGAEPISVASAEKPGNFSVLQWLARDELAMSHKHDEIVSLENACRNSSHAFDPSQETGDEKWKILQGSCLSASLSEDERAEYLVDFDDDERLGALLLYFSPYNRADLLVSHRALLLASSWGKEPSNLEDLSETTTALRAIPSHFEYKALATAVRLEVWQSVVRPVYRALLMGFDDVPEVTPEVLSPLLADPEWVQTFARLSLEMLELMSGIEWEYGEAPDDFASVPRVSTMGHDNAIPVNEPMGMPGDRPPPEDADKPPAFEAPKTAWPPGSEDGVLKKIVMKNRLIHEDALTAHKTLICSILVHRDMDLLSLCIPSFYELFETQSLFNPVQTPSDADDMRQMYMQDAIVAYARAYSGRSMDSLDLGVISTLATQWEFDMQNVQTLFLLAIYEYGKDTAVDELLTKSASSVNVERFCGDGVDIVCRRLNYILHVNPRDELRPTMGMLDASICEWIRERAGLSEPLVEVEVLDVPVQSTHLFALRLLSLAASADLSKEDRIKIHSLIVLSGTLVKALEDIMQDDNED